MTTHGGGAAFARLIEVCESVGSYCLIGGLAVNCYVEPVYTLDADLVMAASGLLALSGRLETEGFHIKEHAHSLNASDRESDLRIQFTTDPRYDEFPARSVRMKVFEVMAQVACLEDVTRGKLWAYADPARRFSKHKKDELDLVRLAEAYPELKPIYPGDLLAMIERGNSS